MGRYLLEVWNHQGERIFQKVLKDQCHKWKLYNNVFIFKSQRDAPLIYVMWLTERKMIAVRHPYENCQGKHPSALFEYQQILLEIDMEYFDGFLIVATSYNFKFIQISPAEVNSNINQFLNPDDSLAPTIEKEASGIVSHDKIMALVPNPTRHELLFVCHNETFQLIINKLTIHQKTKRVVSLDRAELDQGSAKKPKLDKWQNKLIAIPAEPLQVLVILSDQTLYLLVLRKNSILEVLENFQSVVAVDQVQKLSRLVPSFGERVTFQFEDGSLAQTPSLDKILERNFLTQSDFYEQQTLPPQGSILSDIHKHIHFFQDMVIVNQTAFLLRDNIVFVVDSFKRVVVSKFISKAKVLSLHKLTSRSENEQGYKTMAYKVVALHKNGTLQVYQPRDTNLMTDWCRQDIISTPMYAQKDMVQQGFQNQSTISCLYITVFTNQNEQKIYQLLYNSQIIELSLKIAKSDQIFTVHSSSRQRELLGLVDYKSFTLFRNEKGSLTKLYQLSLLMNDLKDQLTSASIFYFQREYLLIFNKQVVFKISTRTNAVEQTLLKAQLEGGGNCYLDAQFFYFLTKGDEEGQGKLSIAGTDMIDASMQNGYKSQSGIIQGDETKESCAVLSYPTWNFTYNVRRLDYDEFNQVISLLMSNFEIIQVPLFHRNTMHFMGMAERTFYLVTKKQGDLFYALDKSNHMNCWSMLNGKLLSKVPLMDRDFSQFEVDRHVYDKDWFSYSVLHKQIEQSKETSSDFTDLNTFKIVQIDGKGTLIEKMSFVHPHPKTMEMHLYFSEDFNQMIELLINNNKRSKATYNLYRMDNISASKWNFVKSLNTNSDNTSVEWHHKTLYPYNINKRTFQPLKRDNFTQNDLFKCIANDKIKTLNTQDGIESIYSNDQGKLEGYVALQYPFKNTKESFYDRKCGQFLVREVTLRLQNFYEMTRRKIFLENKRQNRIRSLDTSAKNFKNKYLIELGFTYLDYKFYSQYIQDKEGQLVSVFKSMSVDHLKRLVHNIFPVQGNTMMHFIAERRSGFECIEYYTDLSKREGFVVPFLTNSEGLTPLDFTVNNKDYKQTNSIVRMLSKAPLDHHSRLISHLMPKLIEMGLPALEKYFDKRRFKTGVCNTISIGRLKVNTEQGFKATTTNLSNGSANHLQATLMHPQAKEQSIALDVIDLPLQNMIISEHLENRSDLVHRQSNLNSYEIQLMQSLANTENYAIYSQQSIRAFIDFLWPKTRAIIVQNLFLPYLAFIFYYTLYLMVLKKLNDRQEEDPAFFQFTEQIFVKYGLLFKLILFLGCFYFFQQDFNQIKSFTNNSIVLWSYANTMSLIIIIFIIAYDTFQESDSPQIEKTFYATSALFIWIRVLHLLKCFQQTAYLLRMGSEILFRMRYLICFIVMSLLAFGFNFYFLIENPDVTPLGGILQMFLVLIGNYDASDFDNEYLSILFVLVCCFNFFFVFTMVVAISVVSFFKENDIWSNEAYRDKAALISLYSYLLREKTVREPSKKYLLVATLTEQRSGKASLQKRQQGDNTQTSDMQKLLKSMDRKLGSLTMRVDLTLKEMQERLDVVGDRQISQLSRQESRVSQ